MRIGVMGAGSIGCYVGGRLAHAGEDVVFVGRESLGEELAAHGLTLSSYRDDPARVADVAWTSQAADLGDRDLVLVCVKGLATAEVAVELAGILRDDCVVLALQNGVSNAAILREHLGARPVWPCMVPFNVVRQGEGRFHQGTSGELATSDAVPASIVEVFRRAGLPLEAHADMDAVLWGKLLVNLNNALNALADRPLLEQLHDRDLRRVMAAAIAEGLAAVRAAGIEPVSFLPVPTWVAVRVLRLPTWLFVRVARRMVAIDPKARSSMWEDLQRGRRTEVRLLNGEVVALGERHGVPTPINAAIVAAIEAAERGEATGPRLEALVQLARATTA